MTSRLKNLSIIILLVLICTGASAQIFGNKKLPDSLFIKKYDSLLHISSWISANQMEYRFIYNKDFQLVLAPNQINNLSFGFSYRFLDIGLSFSPQFLNDQQDTYKKGESDKFSFGFGFNM